MLTKEELNKEVIGIYVSYPGNILVTDIDHDSETVSYVDTLDQSYNVSKIEYPEVDTFSFYYGDQLVSFDEIVRVSEGGFSPVAPGTKVSFFISQEDNK